MKTIFYSQALNEAYVEEMGRDETVFVLGESIQGSSSGLTVGLVQKFGPERVMDTPLSEHAIAGAAVGAALAGYRPIAEFVFSEAFYCCADEMLVAGPGWRFVHGGTQQVPVVFVALTFSYAGIGADHSRHMSAVALQSPGLKVVVPSTPYDAKGLMKTAIRDNNPVCFMVSLPLLADKGEVPEEEYTIPFGVADIKKAGKDVTVVASGFMTKQALGVANELEGKVSVEVVDLRTLEPLDLDAILTSVEKTGRLVVVDEGMERCGVGAEIGMQVMENALSTLKAPVQRVSAKNYPIIAGQAEKSILPQPEDILSAIQKVAN